MTIEEELGRPPLTHAQRALRPLAAWYLGLLPANLPEWHKQKKPLQRARMEYEDEYGTNGFHAFFAGDLNVANKDVLDFGCGYGGRTVRYKELGAKSVTGTEIVPEMVAEAQEFAKWKGVDIQILLTPEGQQLALPDNSFDMICSYDVFEHVASPEQVLQECWRLLRPGGVLHAVFPPFHHPLQGSHLDGYVSRSPFANLLFPCPTLAVAAEELMRKRGQKYRPPVFHPTHKLWGMNGLTLSRFHGIVRRIPFSKVRCEHEPLISPFRKKWDPWKMKYYALPFKLAAKVPFVWEIFTDRVVAELTK
jgi:SAM-dependent methyltransferase